MRKVVAIALTVLLMTPFVLGASLSFAQQQKVVGLDVTYREEAGKRLYRVKDLYFAGKATLLEHLKGNLSMWGYDVKELNGLTAANLKGLDALILAKLYDPSWNYTSAEVDAVAAWFKEGGKFLWVGADSDYVEPYYDAAHGGFKADQPNRILAAIGSTLRIEYGSVEDQVGIAAAGAPYRVYVNATAGGANDKEPAAKITAGAPRVLFHGPSFVVGLKEGKFVPFAQVEDERTFWIYRTTTGATVQDWDAIPAKTASSGQKGQFILTAAQLIRVDGKYSKVLAAGESIMGDRNGMTSVERGVTLFGATFIKNAVAWGTTVEEVPFDWTLPAIGGVIVIIVVAGAVMLLRRKKPSP